MKSLIATSAAVLIGLAAFAPAPSVAQANANQRILTIFGQDKCPTDTICVRAPENERYRIPKELRETTPSPDDQSWAARAESVEYVGRTGTDSCSAVGAGGWTGCYQQMLRAAQAERRAAGQDDSPQPPR